MTTTHTQNPRIIGLTGLEGAGKDSVADAILRIKNSTLRLAFADHLRQEICDAFGVDVHELTCRDTKEIATPRLGMVRCIDRAFAYAVAQAVGHATANQGAHSPRQIMRWWGAEYRRAQDDYYLVDRLHATLMRVQRLGLCGDEKNSAIAVITDVRFKNEANYIRSIGGQIWRVHRPEISVQSDHASTVTGEEFSPEKPSSTTARLLILKKK